jgi:undecaprenyl-diphosphatase
MAESAKIDNNGGNFLVPKLGNQEARLDGLTVAIILGVVEGLTEFIPVSSTGHLIIGGYLLGFVGDKAATFEVAIQLGAILAIVALYPRRFLALIPRAPIRTSAEVSTLSGWSGLYRFTAATLPALVVGFVARHVIKQYLFNPLTVTCALAAGGIAILFAESYVAQRRTKSIDSITLAQALGVGLFQVLALWPGTSRSAATIVGGLILGLDRKGAAEFSFLIAVPIMFIATGYEMSKISLTFSRDELDMFVVGFVVSFVVALLSVKAFLQILNRWTLAPFAWYRILAAPIFYYLTRAVSF